MKRPRPRPRRRLIIRLIVLLVLGAAVNIAVAWGCAAFVAVKPAYDLDGAMFIGGQYSWWVRVDEGVGVAIASSQIAMRSGFIAGPLNTMTQPAPHFPNWWRLSRSMSTSWRDFHIQHVAGWPWPAVWC